MGGYTKLHSSIIHSTIWQAPRHIKILWVTMLALADHNSEVLASVPGLARAADITIEECEEGLAYLAGPDRHSRTPDHEGRRIETVDGGWFLINHGKYRMIQSIEEKREKTAERTRRYRDRLKRASCDAFGDACDVLSRDVTHVTQVTTTEQNITEQNSTPPTPPKSGGGQRKPRGRSYGLAQNILTPEELEQFERVWSQWPTESWNYETKTMQPRRRNRDSTMRRFADIARNNEVTKPNGQKLTACDLAEIALFFLEARARTAERKNEPILVPCVENFFSPVAKDKSNPWQNAAAAWLERQK